MTPSTGAHAHASTAARWKSEWFGNVRADVLAGIVVALALIPANRAEEGLAVEIEILGKMCPARLITTPLFDADGARMRG